MGKTVLCVDDDDAIRLALRWQLKSEDFSITAVSSGEEAIRALQRGHYDLVISDLMMDGMDGFGVLKAVKEITPLTRVIILTGYGDMRSAIEAMRLGADDFLLKPVEVEELLVRIQRCFEKHDLLKLLTEQKNQLEEEIERRRRTEDRLQESDYRFRIALDASSNGVWDYNVLTGEFYHGENWYRNLGYEPESIPVGELSFQHLLHPEDRSGVLALLDAHVRGETPLFEAEYRVRNREGGWQSMLSRGKAVPGDKGKAKRIVGIHTDITRLKEVEAELVRARDELEERVEERTAELSEANVALTVILKKREKDRAILAEQMLSNVTKLIEPFLARLEECRLTKQQQALVDILRVNIKEVTSPFANSFSSKLIRLTPTEIQVANLVRMGKRTKEIAGILHLSPGTISIHRKNIRKKLDLTRRKTNLHTILSTNY